METDTGSYSLPLGLCFDGLQRKEYKDFNPRDWASVRAEGYDLCTLKYDGIWCRAVMDAGHVYFYSRNNQLKLSRKLTNEEYFKFGLKTSVLIGEFMFGQQWGNHPDRKGKMFVFDILVLKGKPLAHLALNDRLAYAAYACAGDFVAVKPYGINCMETLWHASVDNGLDFMSSFEGLCFYKSRGDYFKDEVGRMKKELEDDFVISGYEEGEGKHTGRLGALLLGGYRNGQLITLFKCGGGLSDQDREMFWADKEKYLGKVVTVYAKARFDSGALRSPQYRCLHKDKDPHSIRV